MRKSHKRAGCLLVTVAMGCGCLRDNKTRLSCAQTVLRGVPPLQTSTSNSFDVSRLPGHARCCTDWINSWAVGRSRFEWPLRVEDSESRVV